MSTQTSMPSSLQTKAETQEIADKLGTMVTMPTLCNGDLHRHSATMWWTASERDSFKCLWQPTWLREDSMLPSLRTLSTTTCPMILRFTSTDPEGQGAQVRPGNRWASSIPRRCTRFASWEKDWQKASTLPWYPGKEICQVNCSTSLKSEKRLKSTMKNQALLPAIMDSIANIDHIQLIKNLYWWEFNRFWIITRMQLISM